MDLPMVVKNKIDGVYRLAQAPDDTDEIRLRKACLIVGCLMTAPAGFIWGLSYFYFGAFYAGLIPFGYSILSAAGFLYFCRTKRYSVFSRIQLGLILLLPFLLMAALGGFVKSSLVNIWALTCPLGALFFADRKSAPRWLAAYLGLLILAGFLQPLVSDINLLSEHLITPLMVVNVGTVSVITFVLANYFIGQKNQAYVLLHKEQDRSERLLLNVLPPEIASRLKHGERTIADQFDSASILFADMVGFTPLSKQLDPIAMVDLLNEVYSFFDSLVEKYGVEKIRTIGDNYMIASGLPTPRSDHAQVLARVALEMVAFLEKRRWADGRNLSFRIGMNSGPVLAGVIGHKKFTYDVWGDTVNIASRMESQGEAGKIQITGATYELIKDRFYCTSNGIKEIKGSGQMETWSLKGEIGHSVA